MRKYNWKKILTRTFWLLSGIAVIVLLGAAMKKKDQKICTGINIDISGVYKHLFIDEDDILDIVNATGKIVGSQLSDLNVRKMEFLTEKNPWVSSANIFLDNNQVLQVKIIERQPVARVFSLQESSFYVDSGARRLPLSDKLSARVPVFTGFPSDRDKLAHPDSMLLADIVTLGKYILADSFWMAHIAQVEITPTSTFELIPVIGDHIVVLGDMDELDQKFKRLNTFYQKAWLQNGINTYEKLDVQYKNQVVAIKKGTAKILVDSAQSLALMRAILAKTQTELYDSSFMKRANSNPINSVKDTAQLSNQFPAAKKPTANPNNNLQTTNSKSNKTTPNPLTNEKKMKRKQK
jgi:cell division protein FtsQ